MDNPYQPPKEQIRVSMGLGIVRWLLVGIAVFLLVTSLPIAWMTIELANQEYLHLWNSQRAIYDIEVNGRHISIASAIRYGAVVVLIQWLLAGVALWYPLRLARKKQNNVV